MKNIARNIITSIAMLYALNTGLTAQTSGVAENRIQTSVATQTSITPSGVPMHMTSLDVGKVTLKHESNTTDVSMLSLTDIIKKENLAITGILVNAGNFDGKDELFLDLMSTVNHNNITYSLEAGSSLRKTSIPRQFAIGTVENIPLTYGIKASLEGALVTKDPLNNETKNSYYGWTAMHTNKLFASVSYLPTAKQLFTGINTKDFGQFTWYKHNNNGSWQIKTRTAAENVDEKFYSAESQTNITKLFTVPQFFSIHLNPPQTRGDYTLGFDVTKNNNNTTTKILPGIKTTLGYLGIGTESESSSKKTGVYASYYNKFNVSGIKGSVEVNYNGRTKNVDGYLTLNKEL
jgi:hypothetical protein